MRTIKFLLLVIMAACGSNCNLEPNEKDKFEQYIQVVRSFGEDSSLQLKDFHEAIVYLRSKTGYDDHAYFGEVWGYTNFEDKEEDINEMFFIGVGQHAAVYPIDAIINEV